MSPWPDAAIRSNSCVLLPSGIPSMYLLTKSISIPVRSSCQASSRGDYPPDKHCSPSLSAFCLFAASSVRSTIFGKSLDCPRTTGRASEMCVLYQLVAFRIALCSWSEGALSFAKGPTSIVSVVGRLVFFCYYSRFSRGLHMRGSKQLERKVKPTNETRCRRPTSVSRPSSLTL